MKITIIGGGNMGGAIARGLSQGSICQPSDITVIDLNQNVLNELKTFNKEIHAIEKDDAAIQSADIIVVALKPWLMKGVLEQISRLIDSGRQSIVSIAAGITFAQMKEYLNLKSEPALFRIIPNTAISIGESMTFISSNHASAEQEKQIADIFNSMGSIQLVDEKYMAAGTALASCGIAYAFRYIRAATEAGVEIGFYPNQAKEIVIQTLKGAISLLEATGNHPEQEIDKVTTPGGITIKGLNTLEKNGFTHAVIEGIKAGNV